MDIDGQQKEERREGKGGEGSDRLDAIFAPSLASLEAFLRGLIGYTEVQHVLWEVVSARVVSQGGRIGNAFGCYMLLHKTETEPLEKRKWLFPVAQQIQAAIWLALCEPVCQVIAGKIKLWMHLIYFHFFFATIHWTTWGKMGSRIISLNPSDKKSNFLSRLRDKNDQNL